MSEEQHPIQSLMGTAMESIKDMIDVNTVIGNPIETVGGGLIIPVSRVNVGFIAGGSEFVKEEQLPFGGGSSAGVTIKPVAFLVIQNENVRLLPIEHENYLDKLVDYIPDFLEQIKGVLDKTV